PINKPVDNERAPGASRKTTSSPTLSVDGPLALPEKPQARSPFRWTGPKCFPKNHKPAHFSVGGPQVLPEKPQARPPFGGRACRRSLSVSQERTTIHGKSDQRNIFRYCLLFNSAFRIPRVLVRSSPAPWLGSGGTKALEEEFSRRA